MERTILVRCKIVQNVKERLTEKVGKGKYPVIKKGAVWKYTPGIQYQRLLLVEMKVRKGNNIKDEPLRKTVVVKKVLH